jgi:hypothetical protein
MGVYVYRVTAKRVKCSDGVLANVAEFAYKPSWGDQSLNNKFRFRSGVVASELMAERGRLTGRIAVDDVVFDNPNNFGSYYDSDLGGRYLPRIDGVTAPK